MHDLLHFLLTLLLSFSNMLFIFFLMLHPIFSDAPQFSGNMRTLRVTAGENVTLSCSVDSNPAATISIVTPLERDVISSNGMFIITSISPGDTGTYVCTANNSVGVVTLSYTVDVECK